jgi:rubrerythrin
MKNTGPSLAVRQLVIDRKQRICLRCHYPGEVIHHRRPRKRGGTKRPEINAPENLVWICNMCHEVLESYRDLAYNTGWLVKEGIEEPAEVPLCDTAGRWFWLTEDGGMNRALESPQLHL